MLFALVILACNPFTNSACIYPYVLWGSAPNWNVRWYIIELNVLFSKCDLYYDLIIMYVCSLNYYSQFLTDSVVVAGRTMWHFVSSNIFIVRSWCRTVDVLSVWWPLGSEPFESNSLRWLAPGPARWDDASSAGTSPLLAINMLTACFPFPTSLFHSS